jgi:excisionase family DNA binding protein
MSFPVDICSAHQNSLERAFLCEEFSPRFGYAPDGTMILWKGNKTMADSREVMNIRQASQYLGVSPDTLYKYVGEQRIPAFKLGNRWRFKKSRLDQWMEEKSTQMEVNSKKKTKAAVKAAGQL